MADTVIKALMLDKIQMDGKSILIIQHSDGSPFLHSLLTQSARQGRKIVLVSFSHSVGYYHNVGTRLGWNLNNLLSKNQVVFIGGLQALKDSFRFQNSSNPFDFLFNSNTCPLQTLLFSIKEVISNWGEQPFSLVIDELDCLFSLGVKTSHVVNFFQQCHSLVQLNSKGSLIISMGVTSTDKENIQCSTLLSHWSDLVLTEKGLQTGKSKDLTGSLIVNWNISPSTEQQFHFKCYDRGIKMFAPGTAVL
uniref:Elongator complex protein 6 n=1 Tax=Daphnia galeata TaxID=27404 RepID=A0A8J2WC53_9CRUS|nr:unnamed protein product [Daphnia galeata]